jgi:ornithine cyclodeaminase
MSITILTASDVDAIIKDRSTLDQALASQRAILTAFSNRSSDSTSEPPAIQIPLRTTVTSDDVTALCMPSRVKTLERSQGAAEAEEGAGTGIGVKLVCVPHNSQAGLPATTTLFDSRTGQLKAVVNARNLTALRNACGMLLLRCNSFLDGLI